LFVSDMGSSGFLRRREKEKQEKSKRKTVNFKKKSGSLKSLISKEKERLKVKQIQNES